LNKGRKGLRLIVFSACYICDDSVVEIDLDNIVCLDLLSRFSTFENRQTDVYRIAVEYAREGFCDDTADTAALDDKRCVLTRGATAEIEPCDDNVALFYFSDELTIDILHAVLRQLVNVGGV
jgi:hypothetical protein